MKVEFVQEGHSSVRVEKDGEILDGEHSQIHTALARAAGLAQDGGIVSIVREQRIRVKVSGISDEDDSTEMTVIDGGSASSTFTDAFDGGSAAAS